MNEEKHIEFYKCNCCNKHVLLTNKELHLKSKGHMKMEFRLIKLIKDDLFVLSTKRLFIDLFLKDVTNDIIPSRDFYEFSNC